MVTLWLPPADSGPAKHIIFLNLEATYDLNIMCDSYNMEKEHSNEHDNNAMEPFSCDLVANCLLLRKFLEQVHDLGVSLRLGEPYVSLHRYRDLWLPLVHEHRDEQLIPPPDVAWLWHCHRLAPFDYIKYVTTRFTADRVLEAYPPFALQSLDDLQSRETALSPSLSTRLLWMETYGEQEPFFLTNHKTPNTTEYSSSITETFGGFDLLGATERQSTFLWQVSGERFHDIDFLKQGRDNYVRFLELYNEASERDIVLVPTYQIDLMWHTHMLTSLTKYNEDCVAIIGSTFRHDDSLCDRTPGRSLDIAFQQTKELWMQEYGEDYAVPGGMYRDEPPPWFFSSDAEEYEELPPRNVPPKETETSSKTLTALRQWASVDDKTSEGHRAFIPVKKINLKALEQRENYVLGQTTEHGFGFYHLETREAHVILAKQMALKCDKLVSAIAVEQSCCGFCENSGNVARLEEKLRRARRLRAEMEARSKADRPVGLLAGSGKGSLRSGARSNTALYTDNGMWLYPSMVWDRSDGAWTGDIAPSPSATTGNVHAGGGGGHSGGGGGCGGGGCGGS